MKNNKSIKITYLIALLTSLLLLGFLSAVKSPSRADQNFSPNLDGVKDELQIPLNISDGFLYQWKIVIYNENLELIRVFKSDNAKEILNMNVKKFMRYLMKSKKSFVKGRTILIKYSKKEGQKL